MTQRPHVKGSYANGFKKGRPAPLFRKFSGKRKQRVKLRRKTIARRNLGKYLPASTGGKNVPNLGTYSSAKETGGKTASNLGIYSSAKETGGKTVSNLGIYSSAKETGGKTVSNLGIYSSAKETGGKTASNLGIYSSAKETRGKTASNLGRPLSTNATGGTTPILGIYEYELCSVDFRNFLNNFEYTDDTSMKKVNL